MRIALLVSSLLLAVGQTTAASAGSVTVGTITLTQISPENTLTFDNNPVGAKAGTSATCGLGGYCGPIEFALTSGTVTTGSTPGVSAAPAGDTSHYVWDVSGGTIWFGSKASPVSIKAFDIYWGSIDGFGPSEPTNNDTICLGNGSCVNGADLVPANNPAAAALSPVVNGDGGKTGANDNQWFRISSTSSFSSFTFSSTLNAVEFDMPVSSTIPEPSVWTMLGLGFAALGYAGFRRSSKRSAVSV
jgi:hypothetical protein